MNAFVFVTFNCRRRTRFALAFVFFFVLFVAGMTRGHAQDFPSGFFPATASTIANLDPGQTKFTVDKWGNIYVNYYNSANPPSTLSVIYGGQTPVPPVLTVVAGSNPTPGSIYQLSSNTVCQSGSCGDGSPLNQASFDDINNIFVDSSGNLYLTDLEAFVVRRVDYATGIVTTVAGQPFVSTPAGTTTLGDPQSATTSATLYFPSDARVDSGGNIYIADRNDDVVRVVYEGGAVPPLLSLQLDGAQPKTGYIYTVAGTAGTPCTAPGACGDNGPATSALFASVGVRSLDIDSAGNLYVLDFGSAAVNPTLRVVYAGTSQGPTPPLLSTVSLPKGQTLTPGNIYVVAGQEATSCTVALASGPNPCGDGGPTLQAEFTHPQFVKVDTSGDAYIADYGDNTVRKVDAAGYVSSIAGVETVGSVGGLSTGDGGPAVDAVLDEPNPLAFDAQNNLYFLTIGASIPNQIWKVTPATPQTIDFPALSTPVTYGVSSVTLGATASSGLDVYYAVTGPARVVCPNGATPLQSTSPFDSSAVTCPGNSASAQLQITGAGTVTVTASQPGGTGSAGTYAPATAAAGTSLTQPITVQPVLLTVTANSFSVAYGQFNPSASGFYSASYNFANGDKAATVFTGQPAFSATQSNGAPVSANSPQGTYTIDVTQGSMVVVSSNYMLTSSSFINGNLTITGNKPQTISFPALTPLTYGQKITVALTATASSGGPVSYTVVSGPGTVTGSTLSITGAGTIQITANQFGYEQYEAAPPVTQDLVVSPAPLTVTAPSPTYTYGTNISTALLSLSPTITGWVVASDASLVDCNACLTTTATSTSNPGAYPISVTPSALTLGSSIAANYTFKTFFPGTVTITKAAQTIVFTTLPTVITYGNEITLTAKASSGLPVTLTLTGPGYFSNAGSTTSVGSVFVTNPSNGMAAYGATGTGPITITASQAGNTDYNTASSVIQSQTIQPATLILQANSFTREYGASNPAFTYIFVPSVEPGVGFQNGDSDIPSVLTGLPALTTTATGSSSPGAYPIVISQGTLEALPLSSPSYAFQFLNGTLTVLPAGAYTMTTNPSSLTIQRGQSAQSIVTITPSNGYQGTVTLSCGTLPANVTCTVSPSTYIFTGFTYVSGVQAENPALGTITINTTAATVAGVLPTEKPNLRLAGLLIPGALGGLFLLFARKRAAKVAVVWGLCVLLTLGFGVFAITSCGGSAGLATAAPGTTTITIGASGTTPSGGGTVTATVPLKVTIQ